MKLRVGGWYKTRGGDIVEITYKSDHPVYPFNSRTESYTSGGHYLSPFVGSNSAFDLVEEVFEGGTSEDTKDVYIKIIEAMLTQDQLDAAGRILGNLSGNTPKDLYEARLKQVMGDE